MDYVSEGKTLAWTNGTGSAVSAGDPVVVGDCVCVAAVDIANGAEGTVYREGRFKAVPKTTGTAWSQGDELDFDSSADEFHKGLSAETGDVSACAVAAEDATSGATTGEVILSNPGTAS